MACGPNLALESHPLAQNSRLCKGPPVAERGKFQRNERQGADIGPDHSPDEAGLGWALKLRKNTDFKGRSTVEAQRANGLTKMLATFTADPDIILHGRETIYRDGRRVGWLGSAGFGHTIGRSIGMGYVRDPDGVTADYVMAGDYELEVATERVPCDVTLKPLHDPAMTRVKC